MNKIVKEKMAREIMVVENKKLFQNIERKTWFYDKNIGLEKIILDNYSYLIRKDAEINLNYKQPIPYAVVLNENLDIFVYKRWWKNSNAWDKRLHNKISIWVGWHIEKDDVKWDNPIYDTLLREIEEELNVKENDIDMIKNIWYINNDTDEVNSVHIWVIYLVYLNNSNFELLDWEISKWEFLKLEDLELMLNSWNYDLEKWSRILLNPIKTLLK